MTTAKADAIQLPEALDWDDLESVPLIVDNVWKVLRERVLEWTRDGDYYLDREGHVCADTDFNPFTDEANAFFLFKMWDDCVQLYRISPDDYTVTITCSTRQHPGQVGQRAPTVAKAMFRATVHYMHRKRIKWRLGRK